jgi:hypothetical protein
MHVSERVVTDEEAGALFLVVLSCLLNSLHGTHTRLYHHPTPTGRRKTNHVGNTAVPVPLQGLIIITSAVVVGFNIGIRRSPETLHATTLVVCDNTRHLHAASAVTAPLPVLVCGSPAIGTITNSPALHSSHPSPDVHPAAQLRRPPHHPPSFHP